MIINNRLIKIPQVLSANCVRYKQKQQHALHTYTYIHYTHTHKSTIPSMNLIEYGMNGKFKKFCCSFSRINGNCWTSIGIAHLLILMSNVCRWLMIFIHLNLYKCIDILSIRIWSCSYLCLCLCMILSLYFCRTSCNNLNNNFHINWFVINEHRLRIKNNFVIMLFIYM